MASCCYDPKLTHHILEALWDGGKEAAISLLEASVDLGEACPKQAERVVRYLRNNMDFIDIEGPSLGTIESDNQHLYGVRMDSFPCAWSVHGASSMARIRSRIFSKRDLPRINRTNSISAKRRKIREEKIAALLERKTGKISETEGKGYEPPHRATLSHTSADVRYAANPNGGMLYIK